MTHFQYLFAFIFFVWFLAGCTKYKEASHDADISGTSRIVATDSVSVDNIIASLFLFQAANEDYIVFRDKGNSNVFVTNHNGDLLFEWNKEGDTPGSFSAIADSFEFTEAGDLVIHDNLSGIKVFDVRGDLLMENRVLQPQSSISMNVHLFRKNQIITKHDKVYLLHHLDLMDELQETSSAFYKGRKNLLMTDLQKGTTFQLLPFPAQSKFISGKAFPFEDFRPVFYYDHQEKTLDVIFQNEPILYSYDWSSESPVLTDATVLELPNFRENQGWEYGEIFYGKLNSQGLDSPFPGKVQSLEKIGDDFLISYFPSPDNGEQESWLKALRGEGTPESRQRVEEKMRIKTVLFRRDTKQLENIDLPPMHYNSFKVIGEDIWWMKPISSTEEAESFTVFKGRLEKESH